MKRWRHNCNECQFLGCVVTREGERDLYAHESTSGEGKIYKVELLSRFSNEEPDYKSCNIEHTVHMENEMLVAALLYRNLKIEGA